VLVLFRRRRNQVAISDSDKLRLHMPAAIRELGPRESKNKDLACLELPLNEYYIFKLGHRPLCFFKEQNDRADD
jgi:hypothetical protein